jgi:S-adenosyl methyltransferase
MLARSIGVVIHERKDAQVTESQPETPKLGTSIPPTARMSNYLTSAAVTEAVRIWNISANPKHHLRSPERMASLFEGMDIVEPGVVSVTRWKPDAGTETLPDEIDQFCAVGRKP